MSVIARVASEFGEIGPGEAGKSSAVSPADSMIAADNTANRSVSGIGMKRNTTTFPFDRPDGTAGQATHSTLANSNRERHMVATYGCIKFTLYQNVFAGAAKFRPGPPGPRCTRPESEGGSIEFAPGRINLVNQAREFCRVSV